MHLDYKHIKKNLIIPYSKYWIALLLLIFFTLGNKFFNNKIRNKDITLNLPNAIYVGNGIAINSRHLLVNKDLINNSCWTRNHFVQGKFYAIDKINIYPLELDYIDERTNMAAMVLNGNSIAFHNYVIFDMERVDYKINGRFILPKPKNKPHSFAFKNVRAVVNEERTFSIISYKPQKIDYVVGMPVFNKNYVLQGIVREKNNDLYGVGAKDKLSNKIKLKEILVVNKLETIKQFLDAKEIEYYVGDSKFNLLNDESHDVRSAVLNIICILDVRYR
jgi:hypothetical protein